MLAALRDGRGSARSGPDGLLLELDRHGGCSGRRNGRPGARVEERRQAGELGRRGGGGLECCCCPGEQLLSAAAEAGKRPSLRDLARCDGKSNGANAGKANKPLVAYTSLLISLHQRPPRSSARWYPPAAPSALQTHCSRLLSRTADDRRALVRPGRRRTAGEEAPNGPAGVARSGDAVCAAGDGRCQRGAPARWGRGCGAVNARGTGMPNCDKRCGIG